MSGHEESRAAVAAERRMRMRYGVNEADSWWHFALGPHRTRIWSRLRELEPSIIRIFLYDKGTPDPVDHWDDFARYVDAVLQVGAVPMITFAKFNRPFADPRAVRWFGNRCADVVWNCIEQWGGDAVSQWYWVVWNEPNNTWIGGGLHFEPYRVIYEEVARGILHWLRPFLGQRRPLIGGPSIEGFDPFWMDWIYRFLTEIDPQLVGFVNWHRYADWRDYGEKGAPHDPDVFHALLLAQAPDYETRAREVSRLVGESDILNICGEWNVHSHYEPKVRARFNQTLFGAVFGAAALLQLLRGGADAEMLWTGTDVDCGYGLLDQDANATPLFHAKKLCARYIRTGDWITFPNDARGLPNLDVVVARDEGSRLSGLLVHAGQHDRTIKLAELDPRLAECHRLLKIDAGSGTGVVELPCRGEVAFTGHGVAVVTTAEPQQSNGVLEDR